jgi:cell division protein DivIC
LASKAAHFSVYICRKLFFLRRIVLNKYFYVGIGFVLWMLFFDQESMLVQYDLSKDIRDLQRQKEFYLEEIERNRVALDILTNDTDRLEKYARETYFMKKENEDIFVVVDE